MRLTEYIKLSPGEKADLLWKKGLFIEEYADGRFTANLYFLGGFYVEVIMHNELHQIVEVVAFNSTQRLEKYIEHVSLESLI